MIRYVPFLLSAISLATVAMSSASTPAQTFEARDGRFWLNGKPFVVRSGEMHYPRVPVASWRDRMKKAKAMGLNTICTYVFWNQHERTPGKFDFSGNLDLAKFLRTAQQEGLYVIVRPGPYICTELDFGGFPAWLLKDRKMVVRSKDPKFLQATERYFTKVSQVIQPLLLKNGGPIIMAQVENEYGSFGSDHEYMAWVRDTMRKVGFSCQLFTSDGPGDTMLKGGTLPDLPPTINFGGGAEEAFKELEKFRPGSAKMIGEYWCGWFDHVGKAHHSTPAEGHAEDIAWCLKNDVSFNLYMFHGGTNFEFMPGSNGGGMTFDLDTTSYDYDSPLDEMGRPTAKYHAFRDLIAKHLGTKLPDIPETPAAISIPRFTLAESVSLFDCLPQPVKSQKPLTFEELDQAYGLVLYRTTLPKPTEGSLVLNPIRDYAIGFVDGKRVGVADRRIKTSTIKIPNQTPEGARLDLLIESLSRINFGHQLVDERKGITGTAKLDGTPLEGWEMYRLPLEHVWKYPFKKGTAGGGPRFYRGVFRLEKPGDTCLDTRGWNKGFVWINGHNLGRFWRVGPQQTLFVPGSWLKEGANEVIVYDEGPSVEHISLEGLREPILDQPRVDKALLHRHEGQELKLDGIPPVATGEFANTAAATEVKFSGTGRYLCIESLSEHEGANFASISELNALDADGKAIARDAWKVLFADSEEMLAENGNAENVFDNQPTTYWHSEWSEKETPQPHRIVLDLGREVTLSGIRYLPRQDRSNGRIKTYRVYLSSTPFPGI